MWQEYLHPATVEEAIQALADREGQARVVAGGTDLVLQLRSGERRASALVDISGIEALRSISVDGEMMVVGAGVSHAAVAASALVRRHAPVLAQAAGHVGSPQIRMLGTLGGNVVNAQPAADTALALLALGAEAEIVSPTGSCWVSLQDLYAGPGRSRVDSSCELLRAFRFPLPGEHCGSAYRRLGKCKSVALPVLCAAVVIQVVNDVVRRAAIAVGPVGPGPQRMTEAEAWLTGRSPKAENLVRTGRVAQTEAHPRDSLLRCSRVYREQMVASLVQSALERAAVTAAAVS